MNTIRAKENNTKEIKAGSFWFDNEGEGEYYILCCTQESNWVCVSLHNGTHRTALKALIASAIEGLEPFTGTLEITTD